eukprot:TRINITY_DN18180_c0_g1_i1.p1 TRINITY_DN18180_c0_g1~~TRINITY_DN18180_c0_g1_i1.p1  ORF type:complete len:824 (+),score=207.94 TRINITY_DN18180_c0_g1_i1:39-2474(+)
MSALPAFIAGPEWGLLMLHSNTSSRGPLRPRARSTPAATNTALKRQLLRRLGLKKKQIPEAPLVTYHSSVCWELFTRSVRQVASARRGQPAGLNLPPLASKEVHALVSEDRTAPQSRLGNRTIDSMLVDRRSDSTEVVAHTVGAQDLNYRSDELTLDGKGMLFKGSKSWQRWPKLWERKWVFQGKGSADSRTASEVEQWKSLFASGIEAPTFARPTAGHHWGVAKLLLSELKHEYVGLVTSLAMMVTSRYLSARVPVLLKQAVNMLHDDLKKSTGVRGVSAGVKRVLLKQCLVQVLSAATSELQVTLFTAVGEKVRQALMKKVFEHLHSLDFSFHSGRSPGAVSRILERGGAALGLTTSAMVFEFVPNMLELYLMGRMLRESLGRSIANISTATIVGYAAWSVPLIHWGSRYKQEVNRYDNIVGSKVSDSLHNHTAVKLYNGEQEELSKFNAAQHALGTATVRYRQSISLLNIGQKVILTTGITCMLKRIMDDVATGRLTTGDLVLLKAYILQAKRPLEAMGLMYRKTRQGLTDILNLFQLLRDVTPTINECPHPIPIPGGNGRMELKGVGYEYPAQLNPGSKNKPALQSLNLVIHPKEVLGVVGASGSGKTTLTRLLTRLVDPSQGKITLDGVDIKDVGLKDLRDKVLVVPQEPMLFSGTVAYNIAYGNLAAGVSEIEAAAVKAQVDESIRAKHEGYHTIVGNMGSQLSGGERQRVALARALLKSPRVLIYDEATSSLDTTTEANVIKAITSLEHRPTTVIIAHRLSTVRRADRIVVLSGGRISESGTHDQLIRNGGQYAAMWKQQQGPA